MPGIDAAVAFEPLIIAVLTVSDTRNEETDHSGSLLIERLLAAGHNLHERRIVCDERNAIEAVVEEWIDDDDVQVVLLTGGTGLTGRDITPDVVEALYEKPIPGFGELFRWISFQKIGTSTIQSRATAGISNGTFLFCLPGSTGAVKDAWDEILVHQLDRRYRPCNFVEILPRLKER